MTVNNDEARSNKDTSIIAPHTQGIAILAPTLPQHHESRFGDPYIYVVPLANASLTVPVYAPSNGTSAVARRIGVSPEGALIDVEDVMEGERG
jgi:hypothetical protein